MWALVVAGSLALAGETVFPYPVHHRALDNGLEVTVVPMPSPGVVSMHTWVAVGSRDEVDVGRTGFAHFFEHLMFKDTTQMSSEEREATLVRLGADDNAWTWWDETVYHVTAPAQALPTLVALEADRFRHLALTEDDVQREAGAVYGEFRKQQADPASRLWVALFATAFTTHTYGHDTLGLEADIAAMPTGHAYAEAFLARYYRPENLDVVVAGDVDPEAVFALVEEAYGDWAPEPETRPEVPAEPPQTEPREVDVAWPGPTAPRLVLGWKIPASDPDAREVAALQMVEDLLLSSVGPLDRRLVREESLAWSVGGGRMDSVDPGLFTIEVTAREGADLARIEAIVREEIAALASVAPARLERTRSHARYGFLTALDDPYVVASELGWAIRRGGSADAIDRFFRTYDAVTQQDVARVAATWLVDTGLTRATLAPAGAP